MSLDKSIESFLQYFSTMPWIALPPSDPGIKVLSSKLCVYSIPTLVVLDKNGMFISNNAKVEVDTAMKNGNADELINTWKNCNSVPIEEANVGIMSNLWSSLKKSIGYGTESNSTKAQEQKGPISKVPGILLHSFFEDASKRLAKHPNPHIKSDLLPEADMSGVKIPVSLKSQRQFLLQEQILALKDSVLKYNSTNDKEREMNEEEIQRCLRDLGQEDFSCIVMTDKVGKKDLLKAMTVMNETARIAFARSVLWTEIEFSKEMNRKQLGKKDDLQESIEYGHIERNLRRTTDAVDVKDGGMPRLDAIAFAGLCSVGLRLPEVQNYVQTGLSDFFKSDGFNQTNVSSQTGSTLHRILQFQRMMLCAVGYEPHFGGKQLQKLMIQDDITEDSELSEALSEYVSSIHDYVTLDAPREISAEKGEGGDANTNNTSDLARKAITFQFLISCEQKECTKLKGRVERTCNSSE